jgi:hypothetical protein
MISTSVFLQTPVQATVNSTLNFQGKIVVKTTGINLTTGSPTCIVAGASNDTCDFRVRIWNVQTSGTTTSGTNLLYEELFNNVELGAYDGVFNLGINSVCQATSSGDHIWGTTSASSSVCNLVDDSDSDSTTGVNFGRNDLWMEISFDPSGTWTTLASVPGGTEAFTRKAITSAPSALVAETLNGIGPTGFVQVGPSSSQATTTTNPLIDLNETGGGTPDLLKLSVGGSQVFKVDNTGNIQVGSNSSNGTINLGNQSNNVLGTSTGGGAPSTGLYWGNLQACLSDGTGCPGALEITLTNDSGSTLSAGDLVIRDTTTDNGFTTTTTANDTKVLGVLSASCTASASCKIKVQGTATLTSLTSVARGDYLYSSTTAGKATSQSNSTNPGLIAVALSADNSSPFTPQVVIMRNDGTATNGLFSDTTLGSGSSDNVNLTVYGDILQGGNTELTSLTNVNDTFIYDTLTDTDQGSWTTTTSSASWYTETVDDGVNDTCVPASDDRCGRAYFPKKAVIVATNDAVYIFDGNTNNMWMKFTQVGTYALGADTNNNPKSVTAENGSIYIGLNGSSAIGMVEIDFKADTSYRYNSTNRVQGDKNVANRNTTVTYSTGANTALKLAGNIVGGVNSVHLSDGDYIAAATTNAISVINKTAAATIDYSGNYITNESTADVFPTIYSDAAFSGDELNALSSNKASLEVWKKFSQNTTAMTNTTPDKLYNYYSTPALPDSNFLNSLGTSATNTTGVGPTNWSNPTQALTNDGLNASVTLSGTNSSHVLTVTGYGFNIPYNAVVENVFVEVDVATTFNCSIKVAQAFLFYNTLAMGGVNHCPTAAGVYTYEITGYMNSFEKTAAVINDPTFGAGLSLDNATTGAATYAVDYLKIIVHYTWNGYENVQVSNGNKYLSGANGVVQLNNSGTSVKSLNKDNISEQMPSATVDMTPFNKTTMTDFHIPSASVDNSGTGTQAWSQARSYLDESSGNSIALVSFSASGQSSHYLKVDGFNFNVPSGATILGVEADIKEVGSTGVFDNIIKLEVGGSVTGNNQSKTYNTPSFVVATSEYGGSTDTWGATLSSSDVNASNFGVMISLKSTTAGFLSADISSVLMKVYYNVNGDSTAMSTAGVPATGNLSSTLNYWSPYGESSTKDPATGGNNASIGSQAWTNTGNIFTSNNTYASYLGSGGISQYLTATNYSFSVPSTATITGIVVTVEKKENTASDGTDNSLKLLLAGTPTGNDHKYQAAYIPTADTVFTYGSETDTWGINLTPSDVNASTFGVGYSASIGAAATATVDHIQLTVYYVDSAKAPAYVSGVRGNGLSFDGGDIICSSDGLYTGSCADNVNLDVVAASTDEMSLSVWFKTAGTVAGVETLFDKGGNGSTDNLGYAMYIDANGLLNCGIDNDTSAFPEDVVTSIARVDDGSWHQGVCVKDFTRVVGNTAVTTEYLFVDGYQVDSDTGLSSIGTLVNADPFYVGANRSQAEFFNGTMDELMITQTALQPDVVLSMYKIGKGALKSTQIEVTDATSVSSTTIGDSGESWTANQFVGNVVEITGGTGSGQTRVVTGNTTTVLTVSPAWGTTPDTTSDFVIRPEQVYGSTNISKVTAIAARGQKTLLYIGTNDSSNGGGVSVIDLGTDGLVDVYHGASGKTDESSTAWGTTHDNIRALAADEKIFTAGSDNHYWFEFATNSLVDKIDLATNNPNNLKVIGSDGTVQQNQVIRAGNATLPRLSIACNAVETDTYYFGITYDEPPVVVTSDLTSQQPAGGSTVTSTITESYVSAVRKDSFDIFRLDSITGGTVCVLNAQPFGWIAIGPYSNASGADLAENYLTYDKTVAAGDVVGVDPNKDISVIKTRGAMDNSAIGIIATQPQIKLGPENGTTPGVQTSITGNEVASGEAKSVPVALAGRVPVKVTLENGAIKRGDFLTPASKPGYAMKAIRPGITIGRALEEFNGTETVLGVLTPDAKPSKDEMGAFLTESKETTDKLTADNLAEGKVMTFVQPGYFWGVINGDGLSDPLNQQFTTNGDPGLGQVDISKTVDGAAQYLQFMPNSADGRSFILGGLLFGKQDGSINSKDGTLNLQDSSSGDVNLFGGKVVISADGSIKASSITADSATFKQLTVQELNIKGNLSGTVEVRSLIGSAEVKFDQPLTDYVVTITPLDENSLKYFVVKSDTGFKVQIEAASTNTDEDKTYKFDYLVIKKSF